MTDAKLKEMHIGYPRDYIALTRGFTSSHRGIDMAWNSQYGGQNAPVYAPADGVVYSVVDGKGNTWSQGKGDWGNLVKIKHADGVYTLMAHLLKGSIVVKKGQTVVRGQMVARMNNSGYSNGSHVHFELYNGGAGTSYRVDPVKYCFAYPEDTVNTSTQKEFNILHYSPPSPIPVVGNPVARNKEIDQIQVALSNLRARKEPSLSGTVIGYVKEGYYNVKATQTGEGYKWYQIDDFWCAGVSGVTFYKAEPIPMFNITALRANDTQKQAIVKCIEGLGLQYEVKDL